ncbi:MAG TPA: PQQ-binding-like beta-propeller repeat protein, partial [Caulobacteraceae bacterium]
HSGVFANVDLRTGQTKWTLPITTLSTPWPAGDVVYVVSQAGEVVCISRDNGQVYWITDLNKAVKKKKQRAMFFGPVLASGRLVVVSDHGRAIGLDPRTGAIQTSIDLGSPALIGPIAMNGLLYVVTDKAELVAIR